MPSAANANYWPEIYTNQSIVVANAHDPYSDTPAPKRFGTVSPLDPQLFCTIDQCAEELLKRHAQRQLFTDRSCGLAGRPGARFGRQPCNRRYGGDRTSEFRTLGCRYPIQNNIGRFFAAKFRAGVLYAIYTSTADPAALEEALKAYGNARAAWKAIVDTANNVYREDLTFGYVPQLRGSWRDRLPAIDQDIVAMATTRITKSSTVAPAVSATAAIVAALATPHREAVALEHKPAKRFRAGAPVVIESALPAGIPGKLNLWYRRVNQAEKWVMLPMDSTAAGFRAAIPADYIASPYSLQYYFEVLPDSGNRTLYPGLARDYSTQMYYLLHKA